jgi:hypothetical protein
VEQRNGNNMEMKCGKLVTKRQVVSLVRLGIASKRGQSLGGLPHA